ncbi:thioredoxin-domain-containing protein [Lentinus brumalis]|uniref:Thioredoxin-domain-containing protein n=1 Tax=Lentinus brumalis TaxID=2498619 RepID=A0A371D0T1_9APHY|nr:thioredoxin-domain-containing protein [Polyporus brumalis]
MSKPIVIESVSHWNSTLRAAKEQNKPIVVDFYATWCGPCKLASQYSNGVFLKVDVDKLQAIAQKYQIRAMPTFYVIRESGPVDSLQGADPRGLAAMVAKHASAPALPADAEKAKSEGNAAFANGDYARAVEHYSRAIELAPKSAVLYGNRALAYIKLIKSPDVPKEERQKLRPKAIQDAQRATTLDERWAKGWVRMGEAMILAGDEEGNEGVAEHLRAEGRKVTLEGALEALENAVGLGEGKVKAAQKMLEEVRAQLRAL